MTDHRDDSAQRAAKARRTANARRAFRDRFARQVDPDRVLPPEEREALATAAMRAYLQELGSRSWLVNRARKHKETDPEQ